MVQNNMGITFCSELTFEDLFIKLSCWFARYKAIKKEMGREDGVLLR